MLKKTAQFGGTTLLLDQYFTLSKSKQCFICQFNRQK